MEKHKSGGKIFFLSAIFFNVLSSLGYRSEKKSENTKTLHYKIKTKLQK